MTKLKIRCEPGTVVNLGGRRSSSRKGGVYEAEVESEAHDWTLRHTEGVAVLRDETPPALAAAGLTITDAAGMTDEELLGLDGVGPATLKQIRAQADSATAQGD